MAQTNEPDWNFDNTINHATHRQSGTVIEFGRRNIGNQQEPWARISLANGWFAAVKRIGPNLSTQEIIDLREEAIRLFENRLPVR